ncbi:hypothetical protein TCAL_12779 [Tigriopus californicus]|uniref:Neurotransmitter-gated ion-channel ligand-binding domain-containing protein n=1 Tax=Tigriopus californicus TaxID=6832 RepID=A0A553PTJ6_TIGCA|nr:glycine receptor subunit alpha-3-like [Tigriopus californicus]TRY81008.1 hypothetical protein TCAL_12779 [Tigriopus californicus]|eukprot:TCALIF_12779-PA protein Name:"Similar to GLRA3 Glycine receptor subunit alpha-3 (Homo sapiens)" AED:0.09 eAED:0.09 QI:61/1/1/1/0.42/0.5/8/191/409
MRTFLGILLLVGVIFCSVHTKEVREFDETLSLENILPFKQKSFKWSPPASNGNATQVKLHVTVANLDTIDERSMTFGCDLYLAQSWKDSRIGVPENMQEGYRNIPTDLVGEIWKPDTFFKNARSVKFQTLPSPNEYAWQFKDQTILYMVKLYVILTCPMNFKRFPHDTQTCRIVIESMSNDESKIIFVWDPEIPWKVEPELELPQMELISTESAKSSTKYAIGKYSCLELIFTFKRRVCSSIMRMYIPIGLLVSLSWLSFWMQPEAGQARLSLGTVCLLILAFQYMAIQRTFPPVSYVMTMDIFVAGCALFIIASLVELAWVNTLVASVTSEVAKANGSFVQGKLRHLGHYEEETTGGMTLTGQSQNLNKARDLLHKREKALQIDRFSRWCFPIFFLGSIVVYWFGVAN